MRAKSRPVLIETMAKATFAGLLETQIIIHLRDRKTQEMQILGMRIGESKTIQAET
jgi:hypothetical protein